MKALFVGVYDAAGRMLEGVECEDYRLAWRTARSVLRQRVSRLVEYGLLGVGAPFELLGRDEHGNEFLVMGGMYIQAQETPVSALEVA